MGVEAFDRGEMAGSGNAAAVLLLLLLLLYLTTSAAAAAQVRVPLALDHPGSILDGEHVRPAFRGLFRMDRLHLPSHDTRSAARRCSYSVPRPRFFIVGNK
jgi:hypothetical protein